MARITVEDCLKVIPNKYKLVILASQRASELFSGIAKRVEGNDTNAVTALREIAQEKVEPSKLEDKLINSYRQLAQTPVEVAPDEEIASELDAIKREIEGFTQEEPTEQLLEDSGFEVKE